MQHNHSENEDRIPTIISCPPKWLNRSVMIVFAATIIIILLYVFQTPPIEINVLLINMNAPLYKTNARYLSLALDASIIADNFDGFNMHLQLFQKHLFSSEKLQGMIKPFGGSYLRIGGTMADRLTFVPDKRMQNAHTNYESSDGGRCAIENENCSPMSNKPNFTLSAASWISLNKFAKITNLTILFALNSLQRTATGKWNSENAEKLIKFSHEKSFNLIWELGNEPNAYKHVFNYEVNGTQLAQDFQSLREILNSFSTYRNYALVGPDITKPKHLGQESRRYLIEFLGEIDPYVIDAITWHQYYFTGQDAHLSNFLNPGVFDLLENEILTIKSAARETQFDEMPIWLGETSSASGGGSAAYSDKFVATFIWLDKLGLAAKNGIDLVIRQSLFKGHYALLDEDYNPNPDWWISVLFTKLVGRTVLECLSVSNSRLRLYCHCANPYHELIKEPAVVVYGINMNYAASYIRLEEPNFDTQSTFQIMEFQLMTHHSIVSKEVYLNNKLLEMLQNGQLPKFEPKNFTSNMIIMPPYSLGFWLIQNKRRTANICKYN